MPGVKGKSGGSRPGAGRTPKRAKFATPIAAAEKRIAERLTTRRDGLPSIVDRMIELADGVTVREQTKDGPRVYTTPPDFKACQYLIDRILGKPTERQEHTGAGSGPIEVKAVDYRIAAAALTTGPVEDTSGSSEG